MKYAYYTAGGNSRSADLLYRLRLSSEENAEYFSFIDERWIPTNSFENRERFKGCATRTTKEEARKQIVRLKGIWSASPCNLDALQKQIV